MPKVEEIDLSKPIFGTQHVNDILRRLAPNDTVAFTFFLGNGPTNACFRIQEISPVPGHLSLERFVALDISASMDKIEGLSPGSTIGAVKDMRYGNVYIESIDDQPIPTHPATFAADEQVTPYNY